MPLSAYNSQGVSYYTKSIPSIWNFSKISNRERLTYALTPSIRDPPPAPGGGGHGNQLLYGPPWAGGLTLCCRFTISNDKILRFVASFY